MKLLTKPKFVLSVLSKRSIENNIDAFLKYFYGFDFISPDAKKNKYISALNNLQNNSIPTAKGRNIVIEENSNSDLNKYLLKTKIITADGITTTMDSVTIEKNILNALDLIKSLNKELHGLINQLVGTIVFSKTGNFSSATSQTHLGIIFLNPSDSWNVIDYAEAIYHEFIHLSIFLEDMVQSLFNQYLIEADNPQIMSVLRGVNRPLVKSFHAAVVSIGIMHFYHMLGKAEKSTEYIAELQEALEIFNKMEKYFDVKGKELLYNMNLFLKTQDFQSITHSIEGYFF